MAEEKIDDKTIDEKRKQALKEYFECKRVCDDIDKRATTLKRPHTLRMAELKEWLGKTIKPGGLESIRAAGAGGVSLVQKTNYTVANRSALDEWILEPILKDLSKVKRNKIMDRLGFLSKTLVAEPCKEHRMSTGAKIIKGTTRIAGGELPPGIIAKPSNYLTFTEASAGELLDDES